jgi:hypothetical protein
MAARAGGMSMRLKKRTMMRVSDQTNRREMMRGFVTGSRRLITSPAISGVRG